MEDLTDDQHDQRWNVLADQPHLTDLAWTWMAKEDLRHLLALRVTSSKIQPAEADVRQRWDDLMAWCETYQHLPEITTFATTLRKWQQEVINTVLTGASNTGSEGINRIQKLDARAAFGYRNPGNQRRRARVATLRSRARRLRTVKTKTSRNAVTP